MKNNEIKKFVDAYNQFASLNEKKNDGDAKEAKQIAELAIHAFNSALVHEDPLKRVEMVNHVVGYMKMMARYDSSLSEFLLAKKKMTNYSVLERLSDSSKVSFTLQDCALLNQRYRALQVNEISASQ